MKRTLSRKLSKLNESSTVMQLLKMFSSATENDFKIGLSIIHPESVHVYKTLDKFKTYSIQVIDIKFTGSPCTSLTHSLELMIATQILT